MGQLWDAPAPQGCNFYPILRYGLTEPASLFKCGKFLHFCEIHSLSYVASNFFAMLSLCVFFGRYFAPGANIVPPIAYKSHSTPFPIRPHVLTPHSWLCGKNCGRSSAEVWSGRIVITILECTFPEENVKWCLQWQKHHPVARRLLGLLLGGC